MSRARKHVTFDQPAPVRSSRRMVMGRLVFFDEAHSAAPLAFESKRVDPARRYRDLYDEPDLASLAIMLGQAVPVDQPAPDPEPNRHERRKHAAMQRRKG